MCSYASTCFCYRQFLFICVLCCTVNSIWYISNHINAFFCYCCWNCLYLSFSSYRDNFICCCYCYCCSYCAVNFTTVHSIPIMKNWIREWGHSHFLQIYRNDDDIESHLFVLWHFMKPLNWLELHNCLSTKRTKLKSEISECHVICICIQIVKIFNTHGECVGSRVQ